MPVESVPDVVASSATFAAAQERTKAYLPRIDAARTTVCIGETDIPTSVLSHAGRYVGKVGTLHNACSNTFPRVRDTYMCEDFIVLVSTDRQSAFDRALAQVPFKGAVLNQTSAWWFDRVKSEGIAAHHVLAVPDANVTIGKKSTVFPIEFVMRGYLTGSTSTSIWKNYEKGVRHYCGHVLPEGMLKSARLPTGPLLTPTTKRKKVALIEQSLVNFVCHEAFAHTLTLITYAQLQCCAHATTAVLDYTPLQNALHDELISAEEVVSSGRMTQAEWDECSKIAHALFAYGQRIAAERGLILVDTKYELGRDAQGNIIVVDEIHTPDSSSDDAAASLTVYSTLRLALCLLAAAVSVLSNCAALPCTLQLGTCFGSNKARMLVSRLMPSHADVLSNCLETSRSHSYEARFAAGEEPDNIDKEFLRKWFAANCDPYNDKTLPEAPADLVNELRLKCCVTAVPLHSSRELLSA
eukprot:15014-Heterococcus_DN1.PRE.3